MPQVSLYLDQDTLDVARRNAEADNVSLSRYVSTALSSNGSAKFPQEFWDLFGSLDDESFVEPPDMPLSEIEDKVLFP